MLAEYVGGSYSKKWIWSAGYVDDLVTGDFMTVYTTDLNHNVTVLVNSGLAVERYVYDPYGTPTVLDADWSADADNTSDYGQCLSVPGPAV